MTHSVTCPGCGLVLQSDKTGIDEKFHASLACLDLYWEVSAYTLSLTDKFFLHQYIVDAYAASHVDTHTKPMKIYFSLLGLYLALEKQYTGREVQLAHMQLGKEKKVWPPYKLPTHYATLTIKDIYETHNAKKATIIYRWMREVWDLWGSTHDEVKEVCAKYLD
jgi:hypothetical protein